MAHDHHSHEHGHEEGHSHSSIRNLSLAFFLTLVFGGIEILGGNYTSSLALKSDGFHMLTDAFALGLSIFGILFSHRHRKLEKSVTLINGVFVLIVSVELIHRSVERFRSPESVQVPTMMGIALLGLIVNLICAKILHSDQEQSLNIKSAYLHVMGDLLGSIGALIAGACIYFRGWLFVDPLMSLIVALYLLYSGIKLLVALNRTT